MGLKLTGKIIAFSGISGCGKSTLARILAEKLNITCVSEPEVGAWPDIARNQAKYGPALALFSFRQLWAAKYIDADLIRKAGELVLLDTYFFKINGDYLGQPGMDWLLPASDPYLPIFKELTQLDQKYFPDADIVILLEVSQADRDKFLQVRGRDSDQLAGFSENYALEQAYVEQATVKHCEINNLKLVKFIQKFGDPIVQAERLHELLVSAKII